MLQMTSHPKTPGPKHHGPNHHHPKHHEPKQHHHPKHEQDGSPVYNVFQDNSTAPRVNTDPLIVAALRKTHPGFHLTITSTYNSNLLAFAAAGHAEAISSPANEASPATSSEQQQPVATDLKWRRYIPPARRSSGSDGTLADIIKFGRFIYTWSDTNYILYNVVGGHYNYDVDVTYLLGTSAEANDALLLVAGKYWSEPHDEVLVFDGGVWRKDKKLWESVQHSTWDDVILEESMKKSIIGEMEKFFGSEERYKRLKVPWKRGIIYYGPPAMMHTLSHLPHNPIPTLYVRSLASPWGPEDALASIFTEARKQSPCLLVFEDLDSIVTDAVRSYFLNEIDGLASNDGILIVGSTNHLERLDPGIAKRPSRFDRKYLFPDPSRAERVRYAVFWREKLGGGHGDVAFPVEMCEAIAGITDGFSFAYMQEAFVASLLAIAASAADDGMIEDERPGEEMTTTMRAEGVASLLATAAFAADDATSPFEAMAAAADEDDGLDRFVLWREMKKQVRTLRQELH
ncbi:MAG: hypothetical protein LQ352_002619 [Teloschistes flavicans]|nr:MAG: hypothetical protein LQ352_002619 [Teloschistes flavicans]